MLTSIPTLDEIATDARCLYGLPAGALAALAQRCSAVLLALSSQQLQILANGHVEREAAKSSADDRMLTVDEAAVKLRHSRQWIYRHKRTLPFVKQISPRSLLCSESGIDRWLARRA
jgi:predicted DNA-binding transcriptional regulator AlpA